MTAQQEFGKYQLLKRLASGGMAEVWLARQLGIEGFNRLLVVKRILPHLADDPEFILMFLNEAKIAARFSHPNIAQIFDLGETHGTYFIAMEFVHGEDLGRVMRTAWTTGTWIPPAVALRVIASACDALHYAHTKTDESGRPLKVVHRDVSPQNILISFDGSVKLVDFGIAKAADQASMTRSGAIKGKFSYMAPEQAGGKQIDHRSDIFAAGLVLYELLTGVRPLKRDSELATLRAALECEISPPSGVAEVDPELDPLVMRALARAPDDRYPDARAFQVAIEDFLVRKRWGASSVQISELMHQLFAKRLEEEARLGRPDPSGDISGSGAKPMLGPAADDLGPGGTVISSARARAVREREPSLAPKAAEMTALERKRSDELSAVPPTRDPPRRPSTAGALPAPTRLSVLHPRYEPPPRLDDDEVEAPAPLRSRTETRLAPAEDENEPEPSLVEPTRAPPEPTAGAIPASPDRVQSRTQTRLAEPPGKGRRVLAAAGIGLSVALSAGVIAALAQGGDSSGAKGVSLSVNANPPVQVRVRHPRDERPTEPETELGRTPITGAEGVHPRDTLVFLNPEVGIEVERPVPIGEPGKPVGLELEFGKGTLLVSVSPPGLKGLSFWRGQLQVGKYIPGLKMELYEGLHRLEVRGPRLRAPVHFQVTIEKNRTTEYALDLSGQLQAQ